MQVKCTFCKITIQRTDMFSKCRCKLDMFGNIIRSWCEETNAKFRIHFRPTIYNVLASTLLLSSVILNIFARRFKRFSFIHESTVRRFAKNTVVSEMTQLAVSSLRKNCSILLKTTNPRTKATIEAFVEIDTAAFVRLTPNKIQQPIPFLTRFSLSLMYWRVFVAAWTAYA